MRARQVVLLAPPKYSHPGPLLYRQHNVRINPLAATLTKNRGAPPSDVSTFGPSYVQTIPTFPISMFPVFPPADHSLLITDHFSIQHTPSRNFRIPVSTSPTILRDTGNCSRTEHSAEAFVISTDTFDLLVIGCGPAGEKGGAQAAYFGKRVAVIERAEHMGGSCINTGTVPSKTLRESALYFSGLKQRGLYGIDYSLHEGLTVRDFMHHKDVVVELEREKIRQNLAAHRIDLIWGTGSFEDSHTVVVTTPEGKTLRVRGDVILVATGSRPHRPLEIPFDEKFIFDSDTILEMDRIPQSLAVVGGGVIGCEYASIFTALGVKVALVDGRDRLLPFLDSEISERLRERLACLGLQFFFQERLAKLERTADGTRMTLQSGKTLEMEAALFAAGRRGAVDGLNLEKAGLSLNKRGYIDVNEFYQTAVPHIFAAGDVIGFPALASTSMEQG